SLRQALQLLSYGGTDQQAAIAGGSSDSEHGFDRDGEVVGELRDERLGKRSGRADAGRIDERPEQPILREYGVDGGRLVHGEPPAPRSAFSRGDCAGLLSRRASVRCCLPSRSWTESAVTRSTVRDPTTCPGWTQMGLSVSGS